MSSKSARTSAVATFLADRLAPRAVLSLGVLAVLLFGAALHLGGAPPLAVPLWSSVAALALALAGIDGAGARRDRALWAVGLIAVVAVLQLVPLPARLLTALDPESARLSGDALLPLRIERRGVMRALHMDPGNGYAALHYLLGLVAAYLAAKRVTHRGHGARLLTAAAWAPGLIALVALLHRALGLDRVYGLYRPLEARPPILSPLLNQNHLAAFTGAGVVLFAGRFVESDDPVQRTTNGTGLLLCGAVCALTLSRGGVAATLAGLLLFGLLSRFGRSARPQRSTRRMFQAAVAISIAVGAGVYMAAEQLAHRYGARDANKLRDAWRALGILRGHPYLGVGAGGLHATAGARLVMSPDYTFERVESWPIDLALAIGPVAALVVLALLVRWFWSVRPSIRTAAPSMLAAYCAVAVLVLHDLADFALWLGASGFLAAVLAGILSGEAQNRAAPMATKVRPARSRLALAALAASVAAGFVTLRSPLVVDRDQIASLSAGRGMPVAALSAAMVRHPGDPYIPLVGAATALREHDPRALRFVNRALEIAPEWFAPHAMLARTLAANGYRSQALVELRYAASLSERNHMAMANLLAALRPSEEEIDHAAEPSPTGLRFLRAFGDAEAGTPLGALVDRVLLRREPDNLAALTRDQRRAHAAHESAREIELAEHIVRVHAGAPDGYVLLSDAYRTVGRAADAEATLRRGIERIGPNDRLLLGLATLEAERGDVTAMRATMNRLFESTGGDIDARIRNYGQLGRLEEALGHNAAALSAYQQADDMALPDHPYAEAIARTAHAINDVARVRGACNSLTDRGGVPPALHDVCNSAMRAATLAPPTEPQGANAAADDGPGAPAPGRESSAGSTSASAPGARTARDAGARR